MSPKSIIVSIAAGLATVLCVMASFQIGAGASPLMLIAAFPIYVATLSHGTTVGVGSSVLAIIVAATAISPQVAIGIGLAFTIPASIIAHQANLAQETNGEMEWYPLPQLFFNLCIVLSIGLVVLGFLSGYNPDLLAPVLSEAVKEALKANPPVRPLSEEEIQAITKTAFSILPFFFAGIWLIIHVLNLHLATLVCRLSNMIPRPKDDIPVEANLPKFAIAIMVIALLLSFILSDIAQFFVLIISGIFFMAFSLIGLANLHRRARNNPASIVLVIASYIAIFFIYPALYLFSISGVLRTFKQSNNQTNTPPQAE